MSISIPVFNRLQTRTAVEQARVQYINSQLDLQNLQQNVALDVRQAYLNYQTSIKRLDATEKQFQASEQALRVEQERYNVGASTLVELQQARATFVQASSQRVSAVYEFIFQEKLIEYYQGILDPGQTLFN
jgi:outer membrane protein